MGNYIVRTTTTIDTAEITQCINKGQQLLADAALQAGYAEMYKMQDNGVCMRLTLYLAIYALQSWDVTANAMNYFDQAHLIKIMSMVEQFFYIATINKPC